MIGHEIHSNNLTDTPKLRSLSIIGAMLCHMFYNNNSVVFWAVHWI